MDLVRELFLFPLALIGIAALAVAVILLRRFVVDYRLLDKANLMMAEGAYEGAISVLDKAIQRNPLMPVTWSKRAIAHAELGDFNAAMADFATAIRLNPSDPDLFFNRARAHWLSAQCDEALSDIFVVIELTKGVPSHTARTKALQLYEQLRLQTGTTDLSSTREEHLMSKSYELLERGMQHALRRQHELAIQSFTQAIALDPSNFEIAYNRGVSYAQLERYQEAIVDFDQVIQLSPTPAQEALAWLARGTSNLAIGNREEALADLAEVSHLASASDDPAFASSLSEYAEVARALSDDASALQESSSDVSGHDAERGEALTLFRDACQSARMGHYEEALILFNQSIQIDPSFADAFYNRGGEKLFLGDSQGARNDLDEATRYNPKAAHYYHLRGEAHQKLGNTAGALSDYDRAIELDPSYTWGILSKGELLALNGQYDLAVSCYDKVIKLDPRNARGYHMRGLAKGMRALKKGRLASAFGITGALSDINTAIDFAKRTGDAETLRAAEQSRRRIRGG